MGVSAGDLGRAAAFGPGLRRYLREELTLAGARAEIERRMASRDGNFLEVLRTAVYGNARSPYRELLEWAGCEYGDAERMVRDQGLEPTLEALHSSGVYLTFDEFKGRHPIVRGQLTLSPRPDDLHNPLVRPYSFGRSGGSTGPAVRVPRAWDNHRDSAANVMLHHHAHGLLETPSALWFSTPEIAVQSMIGSAPYRKTASRWFAPPPDATPRTRRAFLRYFVLASRSAGLRVPSPEPVTLEDAIVVARWASDTRDAHGQAMVSGYVSQMVRVAAAASEAGLDLTGVTLTGSGEPTTPAKVDKIQSTGARFVSEYWSNELGPIAFSCPRGHDGSDLHLQEDRLALIQVPQQVPHSQAHVDAFCFTTLMPSAVMVLLNTELDDYGGLERRSCGCPVEALGMTQHVRDVRSYRKLTGEGITLVGSEMERILEEVLPSRFGGTALDYQLAEEEDEQGLTRLLLLVSPRLSIQDEDEVASAVLDALRGGDALSHATAELWEQAGSLRVRRQEPHHTGAGKLMPLHVARQRAPGADSGERQR